MNPRAGHRGKTTESRTRAAFDINAIEADIRVPETIEAMRAAVAEAVADGCDHLAVVGGDGTLNLVVEELVALDADSGLVVALIPSGSGSDFNRMFALSQSIEGAVAHLPLGTDYPVDVIVLEGSWGKRVSVNVADVGLGAACVPVADRLPSWFRSAKYQVAFWRTLPKFKRSHIVVEAGKRRYEGPALAAIFANGQYFGGGLKIAPKAAVMDGVLDIQIIHARKPQAITLFPRIKVGMHLTHAAVRRFTGSEFTVVADPPWPVEADGEYLGMTPVSGTVLKQRILVRI